MKEGTLTDVGVIKSEYHLAARLLRFNTIAINLHV